MKKLLVVLGVVAVGFAFTSCKKDCVCTGTVKVEGQADVKVDQNVGSMKSADCKNDLYKFTKPAGVEDKDIKIDVKCAAK